MATSKGTKRGLDEQLLEGGGSGGGIKNTKWSSVPSMKSNASFIDDVKKLTKDTSSLKGGAKKSTDLAEDRAANRMAIRAASAGAAAAALKYASGSNASATDKPSNGSNNEFMGSAKADPKNPTSVEGTGMAKGGLVKNKMSAYNAVYMGKDKRK